MSWRHLLHVVGAVVGAIGASMLLSALVSAIYQEWSAALWIVAASAVTTVIGLVLWRLFDRPGELSTREGFAAVALAWIAIGLVGALPYLFTGSITNVTDAVFETVGGFSTTGSSVIPDPGAAPARDPVLAVVHPMDGRHGDHRAFHRGPASARHGRRAARPRRVARPDPRPAHAAFQGDRQAPVDRLRRLDGHRDGPAVVRRHDPLRGDQPRLHDHVHRRLQHERRIAERVQQLLPVDRDHLHGPRGDVVCRSLPGAPQTRRVLERPPRSASTSASPLSPRS